MQGSRRTQFPSPAVDWMVPLRAARVLTLGGPASLPRLLSSSGHRVFAVDKNMARVEQLHADPRQQGRAALPLALQWRFSAQRLARGADG